jgi:thymidylate synthase (FAD)
MKVTLLHHSPLEVIVKAIRKCYASEGKSDSGNLYCELNEEWFWTLGPRDTALIKRIIESDHTSTLEHLSFTFDIDGLSRAALQELARHRHASLSVKSTRYTLGELKEFECLSNCETCDLQNYLVEVGTLVKIPIGLRSVCDVRGSLLHGWSNDQVKYMLPEAFKTSLIWTINARSLRNFLKLRSSKRALWEMRELAKEVFELIPEDMKFIFEDCME